MSKLVSAYERYSGELTGNSFTYLNAFVLEIWNMKSKRREITVTVEVTETRFEIWTRFLLHNEKITDSDEILYVISCPKKKVKFMVKCEFFIEHIIRSKPNCSECVDSFTRKSFFVPLKTHYNMRLGVNAWSFDEMPT